MKKTYLQPAIKEVVINTCVTLLAGSGITGDAVTTIGDDASEGMEGDSRRGSSFWDD